MDVQELALIFSKDSPLTRSSELAKLVCQTLHDEQVVHSLDPYRDKLANTIFRKTHVPAVRVSHVTGQLNADTVCSTNFNSHESSLVKSESKSSARFKSCQRFDVTNCGKGDGINSEPLQRQVSSRNLYQVGVAKPVKRVEEFTDLSGSTDNQIYHSNCKPEQNPHPVHQGQLRDQNAVPEHQHCPTHHLAPKCKTNENVENEANRVQRVKDNVNENGERDATTFHEEYQQPSKGKANKSIGSEADTLLEKYHQPREATTVLEKYHQPREATTVLEKYHQPREATTVLEKYHQPREASTVLEKYHQPREATTVLEKYHQPSEGKVNQTVESETTKLTDQIQQPAFTKCFSTVERKPSTLDTCVNKRTFSHVCPLCGNSWDGFVSQGHQNGGLCQNHFHPEKKATKVNVDPVTDRCSGEVTGQLGQSSGVPQHDSTKSGIADDYRYDQTNKGTDQDENVRIFPKKVPIEIGKLDEENIENMIATLVEANLIFKEQPRTGDLKNQPVMHETSSYIKTRAASGSRSDGLKDLPTKEETRSLVLEHCVKYFEMKISESVRFAKKIPGFTALPLEDQANLIKESRTESAIVGGMRGIHADKKVFDTYEGGIFSMEDMKLVFDETLLEEKILLSSKIARLNLSREEEAILRAITITATDRCKLQAREEVEDLRNRLMSCLIHVIKKQGAGAGSISRRLGHLTDVLCCCRYVTEVDLVQVKKIFLEWPNYSQYKLVEEFLD